MEVNEIAKKIIDVSDKISKEQKLSSNYILVKMEKTIKVGDKMWLGEDDFSTKVEDLREVTVQKVGGKYITCSPYYREERFHIDTLKKKSDYTTSDKLFFSVEDYVNQKKIKEKIEKLESELRRYNVKFNKYSEEDLDILLAIVEKYK
jgi:transcription antitermination factor NusG